LLIIHKIYLEDSNHSAPQLIGQTPYICF
jgi:hypothetical protein